MKTFRKGSRVWVTSFFGIWDGVVVGHSAYSISWTKGVRYVIVRVADPGSSLHVRGEQVKVDPRDLRKGYLK